MYYLCYTSLGQNKTKKLSDIKTSDSLEAISFKTDQSLDNKS